MQNTIKVEGQSFDLGFCTCHKDINSFVAQGKKQGLFAARGDKQQEEILKTAYNKAKEVEKANEAALKSQLKDTTPEAASAPAKPEKEEKAGK